MHQPALAPEKDRHIRIHFHITDFNDGGIESALLQWLNVLDRSVFRISLSVTHTSPAYENRFRALIPADVPVEILADRPWLDYFQAKRYQNRLSKLGRVARDLHAAFVLRPHVGRRIKAVASNVDVIVDFDLSLRRLCGQFGVVWLGVNHFSFDARLNGRARRIRRLLHQYRRYDCLAALNQHMADEAHRIFGPQLEHVTVLPNAVDVRAIQARATDNNGPIVAGGNRYIVSVARLDEIQKDHRTLLAAYASMVRKYALDEHLVVVGNGAHRGELEHLASELGIAARVHFLGHLDNPHPVMVGASVLVLSSKYEGMPMVLIEALALGKPIVATDCPTGPREILDHGKAGTLVPVGDAEALADAMARLLMDDALRESSSQRALERAQFYDIAQSNRRFYDCIEQINAARRKLAA
ncbi:glycosyltransferase [Trinickia sp. LjRoot230]|uniref:glycosyltransferase n=1 Tax=Trinickia sp. LjRoot230 TaxID=3342288 RepID=UPI003ED13C8D